MLIDKIIILSKLFQKRNDAYSVFFLKKNHFVLIDTF